MLVIYELLFMKLVYIRSLDSEYYWHYPSSGGNKLCVHYVDVRKTSCLASRITLQLVQQCTVGRIAIHTRPSTVTLLNAQLSRIARSFVPIEFRDGYKIVWAILYFEVAH